MTLCEHHVFGTPLKKTAEKTGEVAENIGLAHQKKTPVTKFQESFETGKLSWKKQS